MLPVEHRLKTEKDFSLLARSKKSAFSKAVSMKVRENALPHSRFGIVVGIKVHKRAVKRNLLRRRLREIVRKHLTEIRVGYDVMILTQTRALDLEFAELEAQTLSCLKKLQLIA